MKVILEIPDEEAETIKRNGFNKDGTFSFKLNEVVKQAMRNGVVIPDNATNGDVIKAMFNCMVIDITDGKVYVEKFYVPFNEDWWEAPYQGGQEDGKA